MQVQAVAPDDASSNDELFSRRSPARVRSIVGNQIDRTDRVLLAQMPGPCSNEGPLAAPPTVFPKVCIVDPNEGTREPLAVSLRSIKFDVEVFSTPRQLLDWRRSKAIVAPSCIISEIRLPEMSGLDLQSKLRVVWPAASMVLASEHADIETAVRAMRAGALSVLKKPVCEQELIDLLNAHFRSSRADRLSSFLERSRRLLTPRQRDIFECLILGLQTKEVAIQLDLSPRTVEIHRAQIIERLDVGSVSGLIKRVLSLSVHNSRPSRAQRIANQ